jgi:hypothetical protein
MPNSSAEAVKLALAEKHIQLCHCAKGCRVTAVDNRLLVKG